MFITRHTFTEHLSHLLMQKHFTIIKIAILLYFIKFQGHCSNYFMPI